MSAVNKIWQDNYQLFINGQWRDAEGGKTFKVYNPSNGEFLATCAAASKADVDDAVKAAWAAFPAWKKVGVTERAAILLKIADIIDANAEHLAMIETIDNGKPIRETLNVDVPLSSDHFRYFAGVIRAEEGSASMLADDKLSIILNEPIGVVGQIVPWNFPFLMGAWKLAPALAAGNCIIFKPSSTTSLSILEFMKLIEKELPAGVLNIITGGGGSSGQYILDHPDIRKLAFTGSTEVGYSVAKAAADKLIPATLELGGKSANIYFDDCNFEKDRWRVRGHSVQSGAGVLRGLEDFRSRYHLRQICCGAQGEVRIDQGRVALGEGYADGLADRQAAARKDFELR